MTTSSTRNFQGALQHALSVKFKLNLIKWEFKWAITNSQRKDSWNGGEQKKVVEISLKYSHPNIPAPHALSAAASEHRKSHYLPASSAGESLSAAVQLTRSLLTDTHNQGHTASHKKNKTKSAPDSSLCGVSEGKLFTLTYKTSTTGTWWKASSVPLSGINADTWKGYLKG